MAARIAEDYNGDPVLPDSTLCEKCHTWNDVVFISSKSQSQVYYESHAVDIALDAACPDCAICGAVYTAAKARLDWEQNEGRTYANSLIARNLGPIFMDKENTSGNRVGDWRPGESRLSVSIYVGIYELTESSLAPEHGTANISSRGFKPCKDIGYQEVHRLVPRFQLRHTKDVPTRLLGVDPWESPFFDVDLLKSWICACESTHFVDPSPVPNANLISRFSGLSVKILFSKDCQQN